MSNVITQLENRVQNAVGLIQNLKQDNKKLAQDYSALKEKLSTYEAKISQLEELITIAEKAQKKLEKRVISALSNLDDVEELRRNGISVAGREKRVELEDFDTQDSSDIKLEDLEDAQERSKDLEIF